jgi:hypothetical protein
MEVQGKEDPVKGPVPGLRSSKSGTIRRHREYCSREGRGEGRDTGGLKNGTAANACAGGCSHQHLGFCDHRIRLSRPDRKRLLGRREVGHNRGDHKTRTGDGPAHHLSSPCVFFFFSLMLPVPSTCTYIGCFTGQSRAGYRNISHRQSSSLSYWSSTER